MLTVLNMIAYLFLAFELMMKMYSVKYGEMIVGSMDKIIGIYEANAKTTSRNRALLIRNFTLITEWVLKGGLTIYTLAGMFYFVNPFYSYLIKNEVITLIPLYLPFIDENTKSGFITLAVIHSVFLILAVVATACTDFMFVMIIINLPVLSRIFSDEVRELNSALNENGENKALVKAKLRNIILMHREIWDLIDMMDTSYFKICLIQIGSAAVAAALELFITLKISFFPAVGLSFSFLAQIICCCGVGTIVELCNNEIYDSIIQGDWFLMPHSEQMLYSFLMYNSQETKALTIGGLAPLNMVSCVSILKTIYSYVMLLYTFID